MAETTRPPDTPEADRIAGLEAELLALGRRLARAEKDLEVLCAAFGVRPSVAPGPGLRVVE